MPHCNSCGKKGLFLKIEEDTGLCLSCNETFAKEGKNLTEKITEAKKKATTTKEPVEIMKFCEDIQLAGAKLIELHHQYHLNPSQELLELIATYAKMGELAGRAEEVKR